MPQVLESVTHAMDLSLIGTTQLHFIIFHHISLSSAMKMAIGAFLIYDAQCPCHMYFHLRPGQVKVYQGATQGFCHARVAGPGRLLDV